MTKYFVTKYALSNNGKAAEVDSDRNPSDQGYVSLHVKGRYWPTLLKIGRDVFTDQGEAQKAIAKARDKKIASLQKQIDKLSGFEI